jgi:enhancing lycopene biosynthesis protein 2
MSKKIAVVLAGCGVYDGAEIHEATLTLYAISKQGASYDIFAPDIEQAHVVNHITGEEMHEKRNVLIEAARIARGKISALSSFNAGNYDAIIFPGGFGAAKNLCTFAFDGPDCKVNSDVEKVIKEMHSKNKPIAALCISPIIIAKVLGNVELTIGQDKGTAEAVEKLGAKHLNTDHGEIVIDATNKIITTPCYMLDATVAQIGEGAENVVKAILKM